MEFSEVVLLDQQRERENRRQESHLEGVFSIS